MAWTKKSRSHCAPLDPSIMDIARSGSGTMPTGSRRRTGLAKKLYSFGSLPSFCLFSKSALQNERSLPHQVIPYFYPPHLPLDLQMIIVGAISSLSDMLNDFSYRLDEDEDESCDAETTSSDDEDDNDQDHDDDDHDSLNTNSTHEYFPVEDWHASFRILGLDGFKVAVWDNLCDGIQPRRPGCKRSKGDICLATIVSNCLPDIIVSTHMEYIARYMHFWRRKIIVNDTVSSRLRVLTHCTKSGINLFNNPFHIG